MHASRHKHCLVKTSFKMIMAVVLSNLVSHSLSVRPGLVSCLLFLGLLPLVFLGGCVTPGDYGDAPDGGPTGYPAGFAQTGDFPTLAINDGAVTSDVGQANLGSGASIENDANDPADPDGQPNLNPANTDVDNGIVNFVVLLVSIPPPATMTVNLNAPAGSTGGAFWVNVLIDLNLDGRWGGVAGPGLPEWVVKNFPVQIALGDNRPVALPPFLFGFGNRLPDSAWMRILLSSEPVQGDDWDGSGSFSAGEVEDHVIRLPLVRPNKRIVIQISCPQRVLFPRGVLRRGFTCRIDNTALGATAGSFSYNLVAVTNIPSVRVTPLGVANSGCVPAIFRPGGPVNCGVPPRDIPIAGAGPVFLAFRADKLGPLPSQWAPFARAEDPPAVVTPTGVTIGFGDATGAVRFEEVEVLEDAMVELGDDEVILVLKPKDPTLRETIRLSVQPGESFGGLTYEDLIETGAGPIRLPALE